MTSPALSSPPLTIAIAERQLAMLGELARTAMAVCRANAATSATAARALEAVLADESSAADTRRARALAAAEDAAEAFHKTSRALRLTLMMERTLAEWLRDEHRGVRRPNPDAGATPADRGFADPSDRGRPPGSTLQ